MPIPPTPKQFPAKMQAMLDDLLERNNEGTISPGDKLMLIELVDEAERLMVENSKRLAHFAQNETPAAPAGAMPVTVWVKPTSTE